MPNDTSGISRRAFLACLSLAPSAFAQERFSIFVGSDPSNVERMLKLARLKDDDRVIDLGSGDGRIVIGAALMNPKLTGIGVDIDAKLVREATEAARKEGVDDRVQFLHQNAFDADLSTVTVTFMWLWPELQTMLRPKILREARPGTRVVTNVWDLGSWQPDDVDTNGPQISLWVVLSTVLGLYYVSTIPLPAGIRPARSERMMAGASSGNSSRNASRCASSTRRLWRVRAATSRTTVARGSSRCFSRIRRSSA